MIEQNHALPQVKQGDILDADLITLLEDDIDPTHREEWAKIKRVNPLLADKVLKEAYLRSDNAKGQEKLLAFATYILELVNIALLRSAEPSDDVDDANLQR